MAPFPEDERCDCAKQLPLAVPEILQETHEGDSTGKEFFCVQSNRLWTQRSFDITSCLVMLCNNQHNMKIRMTKGQKTVRLKQITHY